MTEKQQQQQQQLQPQAVTLLTLDKVLATQSYHGDTLPLAAGPCHVLLVSLEQQAEQAYLMLSVSRQDKGQDDLEVVLGSNHIVVLEPSSTHGNKYKVQSPDVEGAEIVITLPPDTITSGDDEAFADVIEQYCGLRRPDAKPGQGRVELVDDDDNLLGTLDSSHQPISSADAKKGKEATLITLDDSQYTPSVTAAGQPTPQEQSDWLINGAHYVARGLVSVSGWAGGQIERAANRVAPKEAVAGGQNNAGPPPASLSEKTGTGIDTAAYASDRNSSGSGASTPSSNRGPRRNVNVHPSVSKGLQALSSGSGRVVGLSHSARKTLLDASEGVGRRIGGVRTNKDGSAKQPGVIRRQIQRGAQAANVVLDGFDTAVGGLLQSAGSSTGQVVGHHLGPQARSAAGSVGTVGKNTWLVYKDVSGVRRKVILKLAGGTLKGRTVDGQEITITAPQPGSTTDADSFEHEYVSSSSSSNNANPSAGALGASKSAPPPPDYYANEKKQ